MSRSIFLLSICAERSDERFERALHVAFEDDVEHRLLPRGEAVEKVLERGALRRGQLLHAQCGRAVPR